MNHLPTNPVTPSATDLTSPPAAAEPALETTAMAQDTRKLNVLRFLGLVLIPAGLVSLAWGGPTYFFPKLKDYYRPQPILAVAEPTVHPDGRQLFLQHCAYCHGERGDGQGIASLTIPARYFGAEPYKFTTTTGTKIPTDADLHATLIRGIEGSSMPSFAHLSQAERDALVVYLRQLTRQGLTDALTKKALKEYDEGGDEPNPAQIAAKVDQLCQVGTPIAMPSQWIASSPSSIERGRNLFLAQCASCHGPQGLGDGQQVKDLKNDNGTPAKPRNLTSGVFKGGAEKSQLFARLMIGIPGTPMPAMPANTPPEDTVHLIHYILSLSQGAAVAAQ